MGTNFYIRGHSHDYQYHIGKRSAAGLYCWDCGVTLCKSGKEGIHLCNCGWHDSCPKCGKSEVDESLDVSSAGRELGFNKTTPAPKTGVSSCSSFSWAMDPKNISSKLKESTSCPCCQREYSDKDNVIEDEYGSLLTWHEFLMMLDECPVQYTHSIGQEFS